MQPPEFGVPSTTLPSATPGRAVVRYEISSFSEHWIIPEQEPVPESVLHDRCVELLVALLRAWVARTAIDAAVLRNLAVRVRQDRYRVGFDPDICVVTPAPPEGDELTSLQIWRPEHRPPLLAIEVVSRGHPYKDYAEIPDRCAAAGVGELVVFDPLLAGPTAHRGPFLLQLWRRAADGGFDRVHAGAGPAQSTALGAWLVPARDA